MTTTWPSRLASARTWEDVVHALCAPLVLIDSAPEDGATCTDETLTPRFVDVWWGACQHALLTSTLVTWAPTLADKGLYERLCEAWLVPSSTHPLTASVWAQSLSTCSALLTGPTAAALHPATRDALTVALTRLDPSRLLPALLAVYDRTTKAAQQDAQWTDMVAECIALPTRVANVYGPLATSSSTYASLLDQYATWHARLATALADVLTQTTAPRCARLVTRALQTGAILSTARPPTWWDRLWPTLAQAKADQAQAWAALYQCLDEDVRGPYLHTLVQALQANVGTQPFAHLVDPRTETTPGSEGRAFFSSDARAWAAMALHVLTTAGSEADAPRWAVALSLDDMYTSYAPLLCVVVSTWAMQAEPDESLTSLLHVWSDPRRIERASLKHVMTLTTLVVAAMHTWRPTERAAHLRTYSTSPRFLQGVSAYLSHADPAVRRWGMLVAELLSAETAAHTPLRFPASVWDGRGEGREACRVLRAWYMDETPLVPMPQAVALPTCAPWATAPTPRPPRAAPTTTRLPRRVPPRQKPLIEVVEDTSPRNHDEKEESEEEEEEDVPNDSDEDGATIPTDTHDERDTSTMLDEALRTKKRAPVYIYELAPLLRERDVHANKLGLKHAEALIRRKTGWGAEIAEQAVDLTIALASMQDNFGLPRMDERRTAALAALCIAAPAPVVDALYEQCFTPHYALQQRLAMLRAVGLAAQELAGMPTPSSSPADRASELVDHALERVHQAGETRIVQASPQREADVRRWQAAMRTSAGTTHGTALPTWSVRPTVSWTQVAGPHFIGPLVYRCQQARQSTSRTYAGSEAVYTPTLIAAVLHTLCILCYAGRHTAFFATRIAPDVLQMAERCATELDEVDLQVPQAAMALVLTVLDIVEEDSRDHGAHFAQTHARLLTRLQGVAQAVWEASHLQPGDAPSLQADAATRAAGVLLRIADMQEAAYRVLLQQRT
ncbi:telomeric DNA binding protein [Malassezia pachydermatis]|uniref:Telomere length regulation protein conserved domain-containing protein n=1 Tax=Malassezia pachydermatis TaxID=77020 RepID=A0A0M9VR18_9BASI|nr:hypothetical protein Malapachy_3215 [Malassezia pachydermatis]KOS16099.1 hypothetical protein Malapachy_3215 [Malassezia pachydermatis]